MGVLLLSLKIRFSNSATARLRKCQGNQKATQISAKPITFKTFQTQTVCKLRHGVCTCNLRRCSPFFPDVKTGRKCEDPDINIQNFFRDSQHPNFPCGIVKSASHRPKHRQTADANPTIFISLVSHARNPDAQLAPLCAACNMYPRLCRDNYRHCR